MMAVDLEGMLDFLFRGEMYLRQRLRADERERDNTMEKSESLVRYIDEADGIVREARGRKCNARAKSNGGTSKDIIDMGKELYRDLDEAGTYRAAFASAKAEVRRHASDI